MTIQRDLRDFSILVVAERELLRRILVCMLKGERCARILAVESAQGAINALHRDHYHLMLCDQAIRPDATDLLYLIRSGKAGCVRDIPAVLLTHRDKPGLPDMASVLQVHSCLTRPVTSDQLRDAIIDAVEAPVALREPDAYRVVIEPPSFLGGER
ncbi:hypothetical protein GCM10023116_40180 [Kistimonas scapharcae]|uniref:Response regulatory domain-containing protein n=1 Tax=Kistimonas scapharcae TaxID=1036133 RepID=A0ABP8V8I2_9GAMM